MLNQLFNSIYSSAEVKINPLALIFSMITSLILGIVLAKVYKRQTIYTKEFVITLSLLPAIISIIIFLVNGNLGTSVAVAGTFSLIRFRSAAGGSKELLAVFMATAIGITTGMVKSGCRITTVRDLVVGMAGYILSGFLIGSAYRLFRELMPGRGIFLFLLSGSAAYAGTLLLLKIRKEMLLEHARQVTVQLVQNGKWKKVKGLYDTGNTLRDATTKKPVSVVPYTVILELFPDEMRTGIAALARHETVPEPERLLALQPRYIPFRGLEGRGFLPVIRISEMILVTEHTARHISGPLIALGGENSSSPRGYEIILHPDLMEGQEE